MSDERVGVVGTDRNREEIADAAMTSIVGTVEEVLDSDLAFVVAVGEDALVDVARHGTDVPVLPVDAGAGVRSVPDVELGTVLGRLREGDDSIARDRHAILEATPPASGVRVLFDATIVAAEPARISEFSIRCGGREISRFRADGVAVSTPAGSVGYNAAADGPIVAPGTDVVAVVPIAPFTTDPDRWVLPADSVSISVERDETSVELLADGRAESGVSPGDTVRLSHVDDLETIVVPESGRFF